MSKIHATAIVSPGAELADDVEVGPYSIIEDDVTIDSGSRVASNILLAAGARLGKNVAVHHGAVIGTVPQDLKFGGEKTTAEIGDNTVVREYATVNRGTDYHFKTVIGANCLVMAYAHTAHDCLIGDHVIMANSVNLAGHIEIGDYAILGGMLPVHQFVKIGKHAMVGGGFRVQQDICPFSLAGGYPLKIIGLNSIGLKRRGFQPDAIKALEKTFKLLFFSKLNTTQAVTRINDELEITPEVRDVLEFIEKSERGLVK
ncbi:MAG: acyl-ACP--UDP-N-acetylglucosamine O-acyltransferase [candidate division Zixibacteria bacterium]|nr:acyl-ACP--UDP-N-acetylglucosamine O-acyltransferase [candidate division Zixibacteria bacterium]